MIGLEYSCTLYLHCSCSCSNVEKKKHPTFPLPFFIILHLCTNKRIQRIHHPPIPKHTHTELQTDTHTHTHTHTPIVAFGEHCTLTPRCDLKLQSGGGGAVKDRRSGRHTHTERESEREWRFCEHSLTVIVYYTILKSVRRVCETEERKCVCVCGGGE